MLNVNCVMFVLWWLFNVHMLTYAGRWALMNVEMKVYIYTHTHTHSHTHTHRGYALAKLVEALRCKLEGRGFDS